MTTPHPAKRRRLDLGVNKPFRSPLKVTRNDAQLAPTPLQTLSTIVQPLGHPLQAQATDAPEPQSPDRSEAKPPLHQPPTLAAEIPDSDHSPSTSPLRAPSTTSSPIRSPTRPAIPTQTHSQESLESQIALLRSHPAITPSRLPSLRRKWTLAARTALECLLRAAQERGLDGRSEEEEEVGARIKGLEDMVASGRDEEGRKLGAENRAEVEGELELLRGRRRRGGGGLGGLIAQLGLEEGVLGWDSEVEGWVD